MLKRAVLALIFTICNIVIARTLISLLGLDARAARLLQRVFQLPPEQLQLVAWGVSAFVGLVALACWLVFHIDDRLSRWLAPSPALGSVYQVGAILKVDRHQKDNKTDVEMVIELESSNSELIGFHCELRSTVNGKDLDNPSFFDGYIPAKQKTSLILDMADIPTTVIDKFAAVNARMRYTVTYYFPSDKTKTRRTSKLVEWRTRFQATGVADGTRNVEPVHVRFFDEIEE
jgi:hypothetical protein